MVRGSYTRQDVSSCHKTGRRTVCNKRQTTTLESIIEEKGILDLSEIETYSQNAENNEKLSEQRDEFVTSLLEPLTKID